MWNIQLFKLNFNHLEKKAVNEVMDSEWLTMGDRTIKFESEFQDYLSNNVKCSAVSSCTAALHLALLALDVRDGDEVVVPGLTFVASANVVKLVGAKPILADCESMDNWNMSVNTIKKCISSKTKAVIIVHYAGYPCDIKGIKDFCAKKNIPLIEDVAHAPGASVDGIKCGSWGDIGTFSFFSNKNLSIGEGGMISSTNEEMHSRMKSLRSHGMSSLTLDRHKGRAATYDVNESGLNYRMDEIRAAIGSVQLSKLDEGNLRRGRLTDLYRENFKNTKIKMPFSNINNNNNISAYHILPILLPKEVERKKVMEFLKVKKIQSSIHYPAFWDFKAFKDDCKREEAPNVADICDRELTLPLYPTMTVDEVHEVSTNLLDAIK